MPKKGKRIVIRKSKKPRRNVVIKKVAEDLSKEQNNMKMYNIAERLESVMWEIKKMFPKQWVESSDCRLSFRCASR